MNIYEKLQQAREDIQKKQIKKEGNGSTGKREYNYFRLDEIIPLVTETCKKYNIFRYTTFPNNEGVLVLINLDKLDEKIEFKTPISIKAMLGGTEVQNIGAMQTYMRRYLDVLAFDIVEHDAVEEDVPITVRQGNEIVEYLKRRKADKYVTEAFKKLNLSRLGELHVSQIEEFKQACIDLASKEL